MKDWTITEFGAVGDGRTLATAAIQRAIEAAAQAGGGRVVVPAGTFRSGSLFLRAKVELYLAEGAVLLGSNSIADYPKLSTRIEGHFEPWPMALINAEQLDRVRIGGPGVLDGNGILFWAAFWQRRKENAACTNLEVERPRLMFIDRCTDVAITGLTFRDSGFWNLHLYRCRQVVVDGLRIITPAAKQILAASTDGIDVDSSQDVTIRNCLISVDDDNIALKGTKGPLATEDRSSPPVENILIENCEFGEGNGVVTCGSEATIVRNVVVRNCRVTGQTNLICLKLRPDTPQHYHDILIENITLSGGAGHLLQIAPWTQFFELKGHPPPARAIDRLTIRNVRGSFGSFGVLGGNPGDRLTDIRLENIDVILADDRIVLGQVEGLSFDAVTVNGKAFQPPAPAPDGIVPPLCCN
jgi:polygalacturonase